MNRILRRAALAAGSLGVAGGIALTALPASAAPAAPAGPPPMAPIAAWGADLFGPIHFPPVAVATPFHPPAVASNANFTNFLTTGLIIDRASRTTGYSLVNSPLVQINPILATIQASQVTSWCHVAGPFEFGGASIFGGSVVQNSSTVYNPLTNPAPNTVVHIFGATITFNKQVHTKGTLMVTAIYIETGPEQLSIGVTRCSSVAPTSQPLASAH
jgi:hypothetical protein